MGIQVQVTSRPLIPSNQPIETDASTDVTYTQHALFLDLQVVLDSNGILVQHIRHTSRALFIANYLDRSIVNRRYNYIKKIGK